MRDLPLQVIFEHIVAREIDYVEVNVVIGVDLLVVNLGGWLEEEGLVWCKLLEDHFLDRCLACPAHKLFERKLTLACP